VKLSWRLQEHLTGRISLFRLITDFRPDFTFENVRNRNWLDRPAENAAIGISSF
jgi:hypothetical protein